MKVYFIQLTLTKSCNQSCYYCDVYEDERPVETDIDFLKEILDLLPDNSIIELCGGEPGLVTNLDDVFKCCYDHPNVKGIQVMSNGLVRYLNYDWIDKVKYNEHLVFDVDDKDIIKFYDMDFIERPNINYVIVTTEKTTKSIVKNWEEFEFDKDMFWLKLMNPKTHDFSNYISDLWRLFELKRDMNSIMMIDFFRGQLGLNFKRNLCSKYSPQPAIDMETKEIVHCATILMKGERKPFNSDNFSLNLKGKLFHNKEFCEKCFTFDMNDQKLQDVMDSMRGRPVNRRYDDTTAPWFT